MLNQFYFYFHQGRTAVKRSVLTILAIGMAVSLISGVNYYIDSYQSQAFEESFNDVFDFSVYQHERFTTSNDFLAEENHQEILNIFQTNGINPEGLYPHIQYRGSSYLNVNFTNYDDFYPNYYISTPEFFNSSGFQDFFLYNGGFLLY